LACFVRAWSRKRLKTASSSIPWRSIKMPLPARLRPAGRSPFQVVVFGEASEHDVDGALQLLRIAAVDHVKVLILPSCDRTTAH
jgi:hypothetical protein